MIQGSGGEGSLRELLRMLLRVQELSFALMEHREAQSKSGQREIQDSLEQLGKEVPRQWMHVVERLQSGGQPAIVPAMDGFCSYCRIQVPTQILQEVMRGSRIHQCPCCARILYVPESGGLHLGDGTTRMGRGGLARFCNSDLIIPALRGKTRDEVLEELVDLLGSHGWVNEPPQVLRVAIEREELVSTAIEHALAFPHVRGVEGGGLVMAMGLSPKGVRFAPEARRLTRIVFFSVIPQAASTMYLKIVGGLVRALREPQARSRLLSCKEPQGAWETLLDLTAATMA